MKPPSCVYVVGTISRVHFSVLKKKGRDKSVVFRPCSESTFKSGLLTCDNIRVEAIGYRFIGINDYVFSQNKERNREKL